MGQGDAGGIWMRHAVIANLRLFEAVAQAFAFRDVEGVAETLIIRMKAHHATDDGLVGSVALTGPGEGAVQFYSSALRRSTDDATREEANTAGASCMRAGRSNHHRSDDIQDA